MDDAEASFREAAAARALVIPARVEVDAFTRCGTEAKPHGKDGAYIFHLDGIPAGGFENHADGAGWQNWCSRSESSMSALELSEHNARVAAAKKIRDEELAALRKKAKESATKTWATSKPAGRHPYLVKKGVKAHGAREIGGKLVLTASDVAGEVHTLQTISADGEKFYLPGGRKSGCFYAIGDVAKAPVILVAEGFATAASCFEASGMAAVAAFDCGNIRPVCEAIRRKYSRAKIVVCADDDWKTDGNPGLAKARDAADAVGGLVAIPRFDGARAPGQTDFNDMHAARGIAAVKAALSRFTGAVFEKASARLKDERSERLKDAKHVLRFGVKFLDDSMGGITRSDIVLIGAKYGKGKSQLANIIAKTNANLGKRVHVFALEAEDMEVERRMKYEVLASLYYAEPGGHRPIRFLDWRNGLLEEELGKYEDQANARLEHVTQNLSTLYKDEEWFTSDDFVEKFQEVEEETDLVVLDHFHYVDSDDRDDIRAMKRNAQAIHRATFRAKKPVVVLAHIRKQDKNDPLVPAGEAFRGSSDLINMATKAIMIAPDYDTETGDSALWATFMQASKCRPDSTLERYVARIIFDLRANTYRQEYVLGKLVANGKKWVELGNDQVPAWKSSPRGLAVDTISVAEAAE